MPIINFTIQDFLGSILALLLFPFVMLIPGYVFGWALNLFEFKSRTRLIRYLIGVVLSNAVLPITAFLIYRFSSGQFVLACLFLLTGIYIYIDIIPLIHRGLSGFQAGVFRFTNSNRTALLFAIFWVILSLVLLLDLQIGNKLYFPTVAYDTTSRIAIINAISRTGIPPINPGYFPGHPQQLTYLYYYWYIPESLVDQLGGTFINSRQAMLAGIIWTGLCLMATIALYLRLRNQSTKNHWSRPLIGIQLLLVSGVDIIPVVILAVSARQIIGRMMFDGQIESWNMPIVSWLNAVTWVPNHVAAVAQCITAMLAILSVFKDSTRQRMAAGVLAAVAFASALGTSVWVTLVFAIVWVIWAFSLVKSKNGGVLFWVVVISGLFGAVLSIPFISGLLKSGGTSAENFPIEIYVRPFILTTLLIPEKLQPVTNLIFLPLNYFMELGFFFVIGIYWIRHRRIYENQNRPFLTVEVILLTTIVIILSFAHSTIIETNILGIRPWLLGQFVLLVWATDVIQGWLYENPPTFTSFFKVSANQPRIGHMVQLLLLIGLLTTGLEAFSTRVWPMLVDWNIAGFPNDLSPDRNLGVRTFNARLAYDFVNELPKTAVVQYNPNIVLDRPSGLYGTVQFAISDRTMYGVPQNIYKEMKTGISDIFEKENTWESIDLTCIKFYINTLVINDLDPLWNYLPILENERKPLYQNKYYAILECGHKSLP